MDMDREIKEEDYAD